MRGACSVDEAIARALAIASPLAAEDVDVADADDRVLAEALHASWDLPGADVSIMDGWAVRSLDVANARACGSEVVLAAAGESAAGNPSHAPLQEGEAARIFTGAVLPPGADAVIAQEDVRHEGDRVVVDRDEAGVVAPGRFVRPRGSEVAAGDPLLSAGHRLAPGDLALLAAAGHARVLVHRRPRVVIVGTGDELVPIGATPAPGQVVSTNSMLLAALCRRAGARAHAAADVRDDPDATEAAFRAALRDADVLVVTGGISVGDHDHVGAVLERIGARIDVRGVALRPGKPTTIAVCDGKPCFALPGNPAATLVTFELFVRPVLLRCAGVVGPVTRARRSVRLRADLPGAGRRDHFVRARLVGTDEVEPLPGQLSGDLRSIADFDALVRVPAGCDVMKAGSVAQALVLRDVAPREGDGAWTTG